MLTSKVVTKDKWDGLKPYVERPSITDLGLQKNYLFSQTFFFFFCSVYMYSKLTDLLAMTQQACFRLPFLHQKILKPQFIDTDQVSAYLDNVSSKLFVILEFSIHLSDSTLSKSFSWKYYVQ